MAKKITNEEALEMCPSFGLDEEGNPGIDESSTDCQGCEEQEAALFAACKAECTPEEEKPKKKKAKADKPKKKSAKKASKKKAEPEPDEPDGDEDIEPLDEDDRENIDEPDEDEDEDESEGTKIEADAILWDGPGIYEPVENDDDEIILTKTTDMKIGCFDLEAPPEGMKVIKKKKSKKSAKKASKKDKAEDEPADKPEKKAKKASKAKEDKPKKAKAEKKPKAPKKPKRLEVLIDLVNDDKPRTKQQYADMMDKRVKQTAEQVMGLISQCFTFAVQCGLMVEDAKGKFSKTTE